MSSIRPEITSRRAGADIGMRDWFEGDQTLKPLGLSIKETAAITGESQWQVKQKLRDGTYKAKKSGRRTIVIYATVAAAFESLPDATFKKPSERRKQTEHEALTP